MHIKWLKLEALVSDSSYHRISTSVKSIYCSNYMFTFLYILENLPVHSVTPASARAHKHKHKHRNLE